MNVIRLVTLLVALLSLSAAGAGTASATTVDECQELLATLSADTAAAGTSFANARDVDRLVGKVDAASAKLAAGKDADAVQKLRDFQATLNALATAAKPKVDPDVAAALVADAQRVIDCIESIGAP